MKAKQSTVHLATTIPQLHPVYRQSTIDNRHPPPLSSPSSPLFLCHQLPCLYTHTQTHAYTRPGAAAAFCCRHCVTRRETRGTSGWACSVGRTATPGASVYSTLQPPSLLFILPSCSSFSLSALQPRSLPTLHGWCDILQRGPEWMMKNRVSEQEDIDGC